MMVMPQKESTAPESGKEERIKMSEQLFWSVNQAKRYKLTDKFLNYLMITAKNQHVSKDI